MSTIRDKFLALEDELNGEILERRAEIHTSTLAILSKRHHFQVGPPGTAKSLLVDRISKRITGLGEEGYFRWLLTNYTAPEELYGGPDFNLLRERGIYKRITERKLPRAYFVFLDEALALDTPILTTDGWDVVGNLSVSDKVYGTDGTPTTITNLTPIKEKDECFEVVFSDGTSLVADGGHLWQARKTATHKWNTFTTKELMRMRADNDDCILQTPKHEPVEFDHATLPIDPYVLGLWLGNGNNWTGEIYIRDEWFDETLTLIQKVYPEARDAGPLSPHLKKISMANTGFRTLLRENNLIQNKHVPSGYLFGAVEQRMALIQGLCDTDGSNVDRTVTLSNTNENIVDAILHILWSLGVHAAKRPQTDNRISPLTGNFYRQCWKVNFQGSDLFQPFKARPVIMDAPTKTIYTKIVDIQPVNSVPVRCITVDAGDHCFLAGRNMVVTHNCFKGNSAILNANLTAMNERLFFNHDDDPNIPLISLFAASNEVNDGDDLWAVWDRLHFRHEIRPIRETTSFINLLSTPMVENPEPIISLEDIFGAHKEVAAVTIGDDVIEALKTLREELSNDGIEPSERRWVESLPIIKAETWMNGREIADIEDVRPLMHVLWPVLDQKKIVMQKVLELANPIDKEAYEVYDRLLVVFSELKKNLDATDNTKDRARHAVEAYQKMKKADAILTDLDVQQEASGRKSEYLGVARTKFNELGKMLMENGFGSDSNKFN